MKKRCNYFGSIHLPLFTVAWLWTSHNKKLTMEYKLSVKYCFIQNNKK